MNIHSVLFNKMIPQFGLEKVQVTQKSQVSRQGIPFPLCIEAKTATFECGKPVIWDMVVPHTTSCIVRMDLCHGCEATLCTRQIVRGKTPRNCKHMHACMSKISDPISHR